MIEQLSDHICVCVCREKQQLEKELLKSMKMVDQINGVERAPQEQGGKETGTLVETHVCPLVFLPFSSPLPSMNRHSLVEMSTGTRLSLSSHKSFLLL